METAQINNLEITYSLSEADVVALNLFRAQNDPLVKKRLSRDRLKLTISFAIVGIGLWLVTKDSFFFISFVTLSILIFIFYNQYYEWRVRNRITNTYKDPKYKSTLDPHTLTATSEGLVDTSALGKMSVEWKNVDGFIETPTHIFISVGQITSIPIPKRTSAFSSGDLDAFISGFRSFKDQAT